MNKVTIDRALVEQAIESMRLCVKESGFPETMQKEIDAMEKALAEPAVEPTCKQPLQVHKQTGWVAHKNQYAVPVLFNPYTGEPRDVRDVQSDPQGVLIVPPGKVDMIAAPPPPAQPAKKGLFVDLIAQHPGLAEELAAIVVDAPPAEPAVEPSTDDSSVLSACQKLAQAFKTSPPPPAEPARTSQDVCTVPLLSDEEIEQADDSMCGEREFSKEFARAIEAAVRRKAGL